MYLASDNGTGASEKVMQALNEAMGQGSMPSYGGDTLTAQVQNEIDALFGTKTEVFLLTSGTAANALALAHVTPPWGAIFAHEEAHIVTSECGAPEFFSGARTVTLPGTNGKLTVESVEQAAAALKIEDPHGVQPACLSITNLNECGTLYTSDETVALGTAAKIYGMKLHLDGARFANALVSSGASAADLTWKAGVDVMSLGATKNGAMAAEAVIFFDTALAQNFKYRRMRAGHLISKHRFIAAQYLGWLKDGHFLDLARHANAMAQKLSVGLLSQGIKLAFPVEGNEVFAYLPKDIETILREKGVHFYEWTTHSAVHQAPVNTQLSRFVCAFNTPESDVSAFLQLVEKAWQKAA